MSDVGGWCTEISCIDDITFQSYGKLTHNDLELSASIEHLPNFITLVI